MMFFFYLFLQINVSLSLDSRGQDYNIQVKKETGKHDDKGELLVVVFMSQEYSI